MTYKRMKDIAIDLQEIADVTGYDYELLTLCFDQFLSVGVKADEAVRRIELAAIKASIIA